MTRPQITYADFSRLLAENHKTLNPPTWFADHGFDEEVEHALAQLAINAFPGLMMEGIQAEDEPAEAFQNIMATYMLAGFSLGWLAHEQFGGGGGG